MIAKQATIAALRRSSSAQHVALQKMETALTGFRVASARATDASTSADTVLAIGDAERATELLEHAKSAYQVALHAEEGVTALRWKPPETSTLLQDSYRDVLTTADPLAPITSVTQRFADVTLGLDSATHLYRLQLERDDAITAELARLAIPDASHSHRGRAAVHSATAAARASGVSERAAQYEVVANGADDLLREIHAVFDSIRAADLESSIRAWNNAEHKATTLLGSIDEVPAAGDEDSSFVELRRVLGEALTSKMVEVLKHSFPSNTDGRPYDMARGLTAHVGWAQGAALRHQLDAMVLHLVAQDAALTPLNAHEALDGLARAVAAAEKRAANHTASYDWIEPDRRDTWIELQRAWHTVHRAPDLDRSMRMRLAEIDVTDVKIGSLSLESMGRKVAELRRAAPDARLENLLIDSHARGLLARESAVQASTVTAHELQQHIHRIADLVDGRLEHAVPTVEAVRRSIQPIPNRGRLTERECASIAGPIRAARTALTGIGEIVNQELPATSRAALDDVLREPLRAIGVAAAALDRHPLAFSAGGYRKGVSRQTGEALDVMERAYAAIRTSVADIRAQSTNTALFSEGTERAQRLDDAAILGDVRNVLDAVLDDVSARVSAYDEARAKLTAALPKDRMFFDRTRGDLPIMKRRSREIAEHGVAAHAALAGIADVTRAARARFDRSVDGTELADAMESLRSMDSVAQSLWSTGDKRTPQLKVGDWFVNPEAFQEYVRPTQSILLVESRVRTLTAQLDAAREAILSAADGVRGG